MQELLRRVRRGETEVIIPDCPSKTLKEELERGTDASVIRLVETLIEHAHALRVSDIHIDPTATELRVRVRIDGVLKEVEGFPKRIHQELISRIKLLSGLRLDEHRTAQDGRFRHVLPDGLCLDIRVSVAPTFYGENAVLRLLADHSQCHTLETLGFSKDDQEKIKTAIKKPNGMVLVTGPTGSGKTTTLYTLIKALNVPEVSIVTIEEPIEYAIDGIKQIPVHAKTGLTFATGLRSILRQDPDIIMVGEIRDTETASIAVNTALTGHLLLSTLHTNDASTTLPRLVDMGVDAYLVASTINLVIGQRLVRRICPSCKEKVALTKASTKALNALGPKEFFSEKEKLFHGRGCEKCAHTGYCGRLSINEVLVANDAIREAILNKASTSELTAIAEEFGMTTMREDAFLKLRRGETTLEEVLQQ